MSSGNPFSIGFRAARANLVPGLIIQSAMVAVVLAYYFAPAARPWFEGLAAAKAHWGYGFSFVSSIFAGAILPILLKVLLLERGRVRAKRCAPILPSFSSWPSSGASKE